MAYANITGMTIGQDLRLVLFTPVGVAGAASAGGFTSDECTTSDFGNSTCSTG